MDAVGGPGPAKGKTACAPNSSSSGLEPSIVKVLGEYMKHHVKEEEGELFAKLRKSDMDLVEIGEQMAARKKELMSQMKAAA